MSAMDDQQTRTGAADALARILAALPPGRSAADRRIRERIQAAIARLREPS